MRTEKRQQKISTSIVIDIGIVLVYFLPESYLDCKIKKQNSEQNNASDKIK